MKVKNFNASTVELEGSNLIEASAGTGKTYSIAVLTLRLILEKKISVKEILMVTFTKAAVAELEERIRLFVRQGYKASKGEKIQDTTITALVEKAIKDSSAKEVESVLKEAVLFLDETSVLTIHSFCQQTLNEFAFETSQLFGADIIPDTTALLEEEVNVFWRENVTNLPIEFLRQLEIKKPAKSFLKPKKGVIKFHPSILVSVIKTHLEGKRYFIYKPNKNYQINEDEYLDIIQSLQNITSKVQIKWDYIIQTVKDDADHLKEISKANSHAVKKHYALIDEPDEFLNLIKKERPGYVKTLFQYLLDEIDAYENLEADRINKIQEILGRINCWAISEVSKGIENRKQFNNQLSYDDLITKLHTALVTKDNPALIANLKKKYKAVFIDEFQDTDRLQYDIFHKAYGKDSILFFIGDPKQSIYAWRKADIFTYFEAKENVDHVYGMNQNYRSSESLISAMNQFFQPEEDFDTFHFQGATSAIDYIEVDSPNPNTKGNLLIGNKRDVSISISEAKKNDLIIIAAVGQVIDLLTPGRYSIQKGNLNKRAIKPADIGILVRKNGEGRAIKKLLSEYGIPAVNIDDAKVLKTGEAKFLVYLLEAIMDISIASINKALLSPFTGFTDRDILKLDEEQSIFLFRKYKTIWGEDGIYAALHAFIQDYNVRQKLVSQGSELGERKLTNLLHLIELLHTTQTTKNISQLELIGWLKRGIEGEAQAGDEFEQRIESDEEAVNIVTIHKSKGLEYNIVLAPFLDLDTKNHFDMSTFRDTQGGDYISLEKDQLSPSQNEEYKLQKEQENRRLIYVAITRAVYKCFIYRNTYYKNSSLTPFTDPCKEEENELINISDNIEIPEGYQYPKITDNDLPIEKKEVLDTLLQRYWRKMSYSMLTTDYEYSIKPNSGTLKNAYDKFVFSKLTKGAKTGNMLHYIFENIDFRNDENWESVISRALYQYFPIQKDSYKDNLKQMLDHVLNSSISFGDGSFKLSEIDAAKCIHELEFDFIVKPFFVQKITELSEENLELQVKGYYKTEGVMNGKIDLFFENQGKYYVLDWKSNYLGDSLDDYLPENLSNAMAENNYHLQHLIYTLATKKYLESRLPNFDYDTQFGGVIYLFLRGIRKDERTGVFTYKPTLEKVMGLNSLLASQEEVLL